MASNSATHPFHAARRQLLGALAVAALAGSSWYTWMGWDTSYQTDPVTGETSGPYEAWQVIGCAVSLLAVLVGALLLRVRAMVASVALTVAFTVAWTVTAAREDETGMYGVGAILLLVGLSAGTALVSVVTLALRRTAAARRHPDRLPWHGRP